MHSVQVTPDTITWPLDTAKKYSVGASSPPNHIIMYTSGTEVLKLCPDGEIYWLGRKVESDAELKEAVIYWVNILKTR